MPGDKETGLRCGKGLIYFLASLLQMKCISYSNDGYDFCCLEGDGYGLDYMSWWQS